VGSAVAEQAKERAMTDVGRDHHESPKSQGATSSPPSPTAAIFTVVLLTGLGAAGSAFGLGGFLGLAVAAVIAVAGASVATFVTIKGTPPEVKAIALLEAVTAEHAPTTPPSRFRAEPWATLYAQAVGHVEAQRTATLAVQEVERLHREVEERGGAPRAFVPSPSHGEDELVGGVRENDAVSIPANAYDRTAVLRQLEEALRPIREELNAIEHDLEPVVTSLRAVGPTGPTVRDLSPAKMVDALVQTAADGIEDLAAGLMRASELAGVAERVTNRATLLALNAALEATRSGSEAFASIAEETRRLAEYAREATDTISRLSGEIEIKVCETISAIQESSEDAKAAVASMGSSAGGATHGVAPETVTALQSLLHRVRVLREKTAVRREEPVAVDSSVASVAPGASVAVESETSDRPAYVHMPTPSESSEADTADVHVSYVDAEERTATPSAAPQESPPDTHTAFGNIAFGGSEQVLSSSEPVASEDSGPMESATAEATPAEAPDETNGSDSPEPSEPAEPHASSDPATLVVPKIPDWLEGIEPRHRS